LRASVVTLFTAHLLVGDYARSAAFGVPKGMLLSLKIAMILPNFPSFSCVSAAGGG